MFSPNVISKLGQIAAGSPAFDEMQKEASKAKAARSGLSRAIKVVGLGTAGGAAVAGAHQVGKKSGEASGIEQGKAVQLKKDQETFKAAVPRIFRAGRVVQARRDQAMFKNYLSRNNPGTAGTSKNSGHFKMQSGTSHMKTAAEIAEAVVDGWASGQIKTAAVKALPQHDLQKVAGVLVNRMERGDEMASILWRTLAS